MSGKGIVSRSAWVQRHAPARVKRGARSAGLGQVRYRINGANVLCERATNYGRHRRGWWMSFRKQYSGGDLRHGWVWLRSLAECRQWAHRVIPL